ncbi:MAG: hypothetical protein EP319_02130 [Deltaproteobacteria bacterium]|nr:MAG: hypothetical protein EP319_02130 [Deltaproteobacteria bacterium]
MEQNELNKKIEELEAKLEQALKPKKPWYERMIKKTSFVHGFIFSVLLTSAVGIAFTLPGTPFSSGTVISAADVNAKFAAIESKLNELDVGFVANMSGGASATCGNGAFGPDEVMPFDTAGKNDGYFNTTSFIYTVPFNGYFRVSYKVVNPMYSAYSEFKFQINGIDKAMASVSSGMAPMEEIHFLNMGDTLKVIARCDDKGGKGTPTMSISNAESIFALSPL